jgi:hypothetical protein
MEVKSAMANNNMLSGQGINGNIIELIDLINEKTKLGLVDEIEDCQMQKLMESMIRLYAAKLENAEDYEPFHKIRPIPTDVTLTQTETAIFVDQLIKRMEIEVFELQMWRSLR